MPKYPSIPDPDANVPSLRESLLAAKQVIEIMLGLRGNAEDRMVTVDNIDTVLAAIENLPAKGVNFAGLVNAANDAAAGTAGVPVGRVYRNGSVLMVRVT